MSEEKLQVDKRFCALCEVVCVGGGYITWKMLFKSSCERLPSWDIFHSG